MSVPLKLRFLRVRVSRGFRYADIPGTWREHEAALLDRHALGAVPPAIHGCEFAFPTLSLRVSEAGGARGERRGSIGTSSRPLSKTRRTFDGRASRESRDELEQTRQIRTIGTVLKSRGARTLCAGRLVGLPPDVCSPVLKTKQNGILDGIINETRESSEVMVSFEK